MDTIQLNKFSKLHNGKTIFFCKTDFLHKDFETIKHIPNEVVLISGNSDYIIDERFLKVLPSNVKRWYAQNAMINTDIIKTLPMGIENYKPADRNGHGVGYDRVSTKVMLIDNLKQKTPHKFIYSNFKVKNNIKHRGDVLEYCKKSEFVDWDEPNLSLSTFFKKMLSYEAIVCPDGNGPDTHRFYEVLYMGRIPIVFNKVLYDNLYHKFPCVLLESPEQLMDYTLLRQRIDEVRDKEWNLDVLDTNYWINEIKNNL